jgi:hypothetical protein
MNKMPNEYKDVIAAYRRGAKADFLQAKIRGQWGPLWTVPSCSPNALDRAGRQFARCRAESVRHYRRAVLRRGSGSACDVVILTVLPGRLQHVREVTDGAVVVVDFLADDALNALERSLG